MARILIIEDSDDIRFTTREALERSGHEVAEAECLKDAAALIESTDFSLILTDYLIGSEDGIEYVKTLREQGFDGAIVVMTAHGTISKAVEAIRNGADDFVEKTGSFSAKSVAARVENCLEQRRVSQRLRLYQRLEENERHSDEVVGKSEAWTRAVSVAERLAAVPIPDGEAIRRTGLPAILLLGETGSGKGVLARHIHNTAVRIAERAGAKKGDVPPFVQINCAALPATLVEAELFGHEKGAFTDAREAKAGLFEMADSGTIFLDEIGEMPLELQAKLLLAVEQGLFRRVGGSKERSVRVRVIAATNQDLQQRAAKGQFRQDLYYRLNTFTISIPPLRARGDDVIQLAESLLSNLGRQYGRSDLTFSPAARGALRRHNWPGNVRELVNCIQRAVLLCEGKSVEAADLGLMQDAVPAAAGIAEGGLPVFDFRSRSYTVDEVEKALLVQALEHTRGNITRAAKLLDMQRSSLRYRIERHNLTNLVGELTAQ